MQENGVENTPIYFGNNNTDISVNITDNDYMRNMQERIVKLSSDLSWAEQQLEMKDLIIEELLNQLKKSYG